MYIDPYQLIKESGAVWLKSNFHTHAGTGAGTCGENIIGTVLEMYKLAGYDVLAISNHDLLTDMAGYEKDFDIILFNSFEYSAEPHMLCINVDEAYLDEHQSVVDKTKNASGFVILCHPNWQRQGYWPLESIKKLSGYSGIEIYNSVIKRLQGSALATDTWDALLSSGILAWGFANDDFHKWFDLSRAWITILSKSRDRSDILDSIEKGSFVASTGLMLDKYVFDGSSLSLSASLPKMVQKENFRYTFIGKDGEILSEQYSEEGKYELSGDELYVRVRVAADDGSLLFTQPLYKQDAFRRP